MTRRRPEKSPPVRKRRAKRAQQPSEPPSAANLDALWAHHHGQFRDPHEIIVQWQNMSQVDPRLLDYRVKGPWWDLLEEAGVTLIASREYEHLLTAIGAHAGRKQLTYLRLPHPSGVVYDEKRARLHVASTRNPNLVFEFAASSGGTTPQGADAERFRGLLLPVRSRYLPGSLYLHDLALIGGRLYANAVGMNAVVRLPEEGGFEPAWWPRSIDRAGREPHFDKNYLQLNSIAAGRSLATSFFTASAAVPSTRRPGHLDFPVDGRGVLFSGRTREVVVDGLTRPHSARRWRGRTWLDNSGYGELGVVRGKQLDTVARLPGWTRGLCFAGEIAFVATSRVIPRFRRYAPGLDLAQSCCGIHAVELSSGRTLASLTWQHGNQIFALEALPATLCRGFPFRRNTASNARFLKEFFSVARF